MQIFPLNHRTKISLIIAAKKYYTKEGAVFDDDLLPKTTTEAFEQIDIFSDEDEDDWDWDEEWKK